MKLIVVWSAGLAAFLCIFATPSPSRAEPIAALSEAVSRRILYYNLQPPGFPIGSIEPSEYHHLRFVLGPSTVVYRSRFNAPSITEQVIGGYHTIWFYNGCGGNVGLMSDSEIGVVREFLFKGGNLVLSADDAYGDADSGYGDCQARVNQIANNLGVNFAGTGIYFTPSSPSGIVEEYCWNVVGSHPILDGGSGKLFYYTPAMTTELLPEANAWGATAPYIPARIDDVRLRGRSEQNRAAFAVTDAHDPHGAVVYSVNFNAFHNTCNPDALKRVFRYLRFLS